MGTGTGYSTTHFFSRIGEAGIFTARSRAAMLSLAATLASPAAALAHHAAFGWPSYQGFTPAHPYRDGLIFQPGPNGPVPVHVRIYSTPHEPPYYNVPPYIVLDP